MMRVSPHPRSTTMKMPDKKDGPKLPPKPKGGGAAARQRQFQMERGLPADPPPEAAGGAETTNAAPDDTCEPTPTRGGPKKPKPKPKA